MGCGIEAVLVVAVLVAAAQGYGNTQNNNVVMKDGIGIRKCDYPFPRSPSTAAEVMCNARVFCVNDLNSPTTPWYLLQSRSSRSRAFNTNYAAYEYGFGRSLVDDYWLGLWCLHMMTASGDNELLVRVWDRTGNAGAAVYSSFGVGPPASKYQLRVEGFDAEVSDAGDAMAESNGQQFTAFDQDNDENRWTNCARRYKGGWWYQDCTLNAVNNFLNGYLTQGYGRRDRGAQWETWATHSPVVSTLMLFRPQHARSPCENSTSLIPINRCPEGTAFSSMSYSCFLVSDSNLRGNFTDAVDFCADQGMRVASIRSQEEEDFVARLLGVGSSVWIDLGDEETEGIYVWGDGSPLSYNHLSLIEAADPGHQRNCVAMDIYTLYHWIALSCSDSRRFLCQMPAIIE